MIGTVQTGVREEEIERKSPQDKNHVVWRAQNCVHVNRIIKLHAVPAIQIFKKVTMGIIVAKFRFSLKKIHNYAAKPD